MIVSGGGFAGGEPSRTGTVPYEPDGTGIPSSSVAKPADGPVRRRVRDETPRPATVTAMDEETPQHEPGDTGQTARIDPLLAPGFARRRRWIEILVTLLAVALGFLVLSSMERDGDSHTRHTGRHGHISTQHAVLRARCGTVADLIDQHGLPEKFIRIAWRESRCQPWQVNLDGEASYGLFQINTRGRLIEEARSRCGVTEPEELLDPVTNVRCAAALYEAYGERPWLSGRYFR